MSMRNKVFLGIGVGILLAPIVANALILTHNLSFGTVGDDVLELQRFLNTDERTRVSFFGSGSRGNETSYFGSLTADAVRRYQELNARDILVPAGLSSGNGFVGPLTRAHMALDGATQVQVLLSVPPESTDTVDENGDGGDDDENQTGAPTVTSLFRSSVSEKTKIIVYGSGFLGSGNEVRTNYGNFKNVLSADGTTLSVILDVASSPTQTGGEVDGALYVENKNGKSNLVFFTLGL